ncbi:MAG: Hpt domain-containing protein [Planctomycetes bacterium]|nr:Hpt domain-containing protein [Planctomycetota bacterium]
MPTLSPPIVPLRSDRADDPRFLPLLLAYVDDLARTRDRVRALVETGDGVALARCAHHLSGTGGAYGYPAVGDAAAHLERVLSDGEVGAAHAAVDALLDVLTRAIVGAPRLVTAAA